MKSLTSLDKLPYKMLCWEQVFRKHYYKHTRKRKDRQLSRQIPNGFSLKEKLEIVLPEFGELVINDAEAKRIIESADKAISGIYNLLGSGDVLINPIRWNYDFVSGYVWENKYYKSYDQINIKSSSDVKKPRELSRSHHMLHCAIAYRLTHDKKYADLIIDQILDWNRQNPLMFSINWGCAMDVAIRAVNWIWALRLIVDYDRFDQYDNLFSNLLYKHGWFIYRNLEKSLYNNQNHYLSDVLGLVFIGALFKEQDKEAKLWYDEGKREIFKEMRYEILPSGVSYEKSTSYNRLVLEIFLHACWLFKKNGEEIPLDVDYRLRSMFDFILNTIQPDGNTPIIGDQDNGRIFPFGTESVIDYRYLLSLGACLFNDSRYIPFSEGFNVYCNILCGEKTKSLFEDTKANKEGVLHSKAYPDAGYFVLRNEDFYVMFNCSGKGKYPELSNGTHTHSDLLSFVLSYKGRPMFCDPGSYQYSGNPKERMLFRSTLQHNTITVDELSQNDLKENQLWDFPGNAKPSILDWQIDGDVEYVRASHNGYERLSNPVIHERKLSLNKTDNSVELIDYLEIQGQQLHSFEMSFQLDDMVVAEKVDNNTVKLKSNDCSLLVSFQSEMPLELSIKPSRISKSYGTALDTHRISLTTKSNTSFQIKTIIK